MKVNIRKFNSGPTERKMNIQIDKWDTYSMDHTLSVIILPLLLQLKDSKMGVPSEFVNSIGHDLDGNYYFDFINEDSNAVFDAGCKKWDEVLDKMIWSFQQIVFGDYDDAYHHGKFEFDWQKTKPMINPLTGKMESMSEMKDKNPNGHWYDHVGHQLHEERIQEGLNLFGKHYRDLWS